MNKTVSIYLDLVRFLAALTVFLSHFGFTRLTGGAYSWFRELNFGSDAVIVFFVLSGFVIAYVADTKEKDLSSYTISRFSRLYSVVLPALILTFLLDKWGATLDPVAYDGWWHASDSSILRFFANLFYINELWFYGIKPSTNSAFWSLGYEFWYYVLFAAAFYFKGNLRIVLITVILLITGPKIMVLFPIWLMGVGVYYFNRRHTVAEFAGWFLFLFPVFAYWLIKVFGIDHQALSLTKASLGSDFVQYKLWHSDEFVISYLYGLLIAMNFIGINAISSRIGGLLSACERTVRYWAGLTFSMYLYHYPLLQFFNTITMYGFEKDDPVRHVLLLIIIVTLIVLLGSVTEKKKYVFRQVLEKIMPMNLLAKLTRSS